MQARRSIALGRVTVHLGERGVGRLLRGRGKTGHKSYTAILTSSIPEPKPLDLHRIQSSLLGVGGQGMGSQGLLQARLLLCLPIRVP